MKPKGQTEHETGFLEYLEDVIGSNHYVDEIVKTGSTVETLNEERALKLNRVKAVEAERENLEARQLQRPLVWIVNAVYCRVLNRRQRNS